MIIKNALLGTAGVYPCSLPSWTKEFYIYRIFYLFIEAKYNCLFNYNQVCKTYTRHEANTVRFGSKLKKTNKKAQVPLSHYYKILSE